MSWIPFAPRHVSWVVLLVCLLATLIAWGAARQLENRAAQTRFDAAASRLARVVERSGSDSVEAARVLRLLWVLHAAPTSSQFQAFVAPIMDRQRHLLALEFIRVVPRAERRAYEQQLSARRQGAVITAIGPDRRLQPAPDADQHAVIEYVVPLADNPNTPGFDVLSSPGIAGVLDAAQRSGDLTMAPARVLVQDLEHSTLRNGLVAYIPLYRETWWPKTEEERRRQLLGYAAVVVRAEALFQRVLERTGSPESTGVAMQVYDSPTVVPETMIFQAGHPSPGHVIQPMVRQIKVVNRVWTLVAAPTAQAFAPPRMASWVVLGSGLVVSGLLWLLVHLLRRQMRGIEAAVIARTTDLEAARTVLEGQNQLYGALLKALSDMGDALAIVQQQRFVYVNDCLPRMLGRSRGALLDLANFTDIVPPEDRAQVLMRYEHRVEAGTLPDVFEIRLLRVDGRVLDVAAAVVQVLWQGAPAVVLEVRDISERKRAEQRIHHLAHHDSLTDLPNRLLLLDRLKAALALGRRHRKQVAVLYLDLDHFKRVNDEHGHDQGDALLTVVAARLRTCVRQTDTVARLGGDEFVVVLPDLSSRNDALAVARKVIASVHEPVRLEGGVVLHTSTSIGIAVGTPDHHSPESLLKRADEAMYQAKQRGRNTWCLAEDDPPEPGSPQPPLRGQTGDENEDEIPPAHS